MHELHDHLITIIRHHQLTSLFQPIVDLKGKSIFAHEALIRGPSGSPLHKPINLFAAADRLQQSLALEHACRKVSIRQFAAQGLPQKLFLNVRPAVLMDPAFKKGKTLAFLRQAGIDAGRIVIEITEQQPTDNFPLMRDAVNHYRGMGFEIALDDLGAGYSGLRLWTELLPDYVKIDRHFIQDIDKDAVKQKFVRSLQSMAAATNCRVIAEGVETSGEYHVIQALGLALAQGYYFARPSVQAVTEISASLFNEKRQSNPYLINRCPSVRKNIDQSSCQDPEQEPFKVAG